MNIQRQYRRPRTKNHPMFPLKNTLEDTVAKQIVQVLGNVDLREYVATGYEQEHIEYIRESVYTPDFRLPNGVLIETKGFFEPEDRTKHLLIQKQHPELDIRFIFANAQLKLSIGSKTTYAQWCDKHGFLWSNRKIPKEWFE